jgi:hypothetical protein
VRSIVSGASDRSLVLSNFYLWAAEKVFYTKSDERKIYDFWAMAGLEILDKYTVVTGFSISRDREQGTGESF